MISVSNRINRLSNGRSCVGTLGVDIGSRSIRMVRTEQTGKVWKITNRLTLPLEATDDDLTTLLRTGHLGQQLSVLKNRPLATRQECCCVLPMTATDIRAVEVPNGSDEDVMKMALESLRDSLEDYDDRVTRLWRHSVSPHGLVMVSGISVPSDIGETLVHELRAARLDCTSIGSKPFVLAQALSMSHPDAQDEPIGLISWEHSATTFVVVRQGRPEFIRTLRDCAGRNILRRISEGMNIDTIDASRVLSQFGLPERTGGASSSVITRSLEQLTGRELQTVCSELRKTLTYLRHHLSKLMPGQLLMFGDLAAVPNICQPIEAELGISVLPWSLGAVNSQPSDPMFAAAIAASRGVPTL